jgi:hypothetical protein
LVKNLNIDTYADRCGHKVSNFITLTVHPPKIKTFQKNYVHLRDLHSITLRVRIPGAEDGPYIAPNESGGT